MQEVQADADLLQTYLRVYISDGGRALDISGFLKDLDDAYCHLLAFNRVVDHFDKERNSIRSINYVNKYGTYLTVIESALADAAEGITGDAPSLYLAGVSVQSTGWMDFLAALTPLESIRKYLQDRHERKLDNQHKYQDTGLVLGAAWADEDGDELPQVTPMGEIQIQDDICPSLLNMNMMNFSHRFVTYSAISAWRIS